MTAKMRIDAARRVATPAISLVPTSLITGRHFCLPRRPLSSRYASQKFHMRNQLRNGNTCGTIP